MFPSSSGGFSVVGSNTKDFRHMGLLHLLLSHAVGFPSYHAFSGHSLQELQRCCAGLRLFSSISA